MENNNKSFIPKELKKMNKINTFITENEFNRADVVINTIETNYNGMPKQTYHIITNKGDGWMVYPNGKGQLGVSMTPKLIREYIKDLDIATVVYTLYDEDSM